MHRPRGAATTLLALVLMAGGAGAHEFWISPHAGRVAPGEEIVADLRVGEMLRGEVHPYLSDRFHAFVVATREARRPIEGLEGDIPAVAGLAARPGLNILAQASIDFRVTHDDWTVFRAYLEEEGYSRLAALHRERGLPETGFDERYARYVKALVQAGPIEPVDRDVALGLPLELVAEENPYAPGLETLAVTLLDGGDPVAGRRVGVLHDDGERVSRTPYETDAGGRIVFPLSGPGEYLVSAVTLAPAEDGRVAWSSRWAALGFRLPPRE